MNPTGLPLQGGSLAALSAAASPDQIIVALNEIIGSINAQLELKQFLDAKGDSVSVGVLPDTTIGFGVNDSIRLGILPDTTLGFGVANVIRLGVLPDGSTGFKVIDSHGIGLAFFGIFPNGTTALKIAKPGIEVMTASDNDLIFNSAQDVFKIVKSGIASLTIPIGSYAAGADKTTFIAVPPGFVGTPDYRLLTQIPLVTSIGNGLQGTPAFSYALFTVNGGGVNIYLPETVTYGTIDSTGLTIHTQFLTAAGFGSAYTWNYKYYLLQESAVQ